EDYFQGHFPGAPVMPGVLQIASMSQVANAVLRKRGLQSPDCFYWMSGIRRLKFRNPASPGDRLLTDVTIQAIDSNSGRVTVTAIVHTGETTNCEGTLDLVPTTEDALLSRQRGFAPATESESTERGQTVLEATDIMGVIPHRFPFLLIDRVLELDKDNSRIRVLKNITGHEPLLEGYPVPVLPGYIQAEIGAQAGCTLALSLPENRNKLAYFMSIDEAHFTQPVVPGDQLLIDVVVSTRGRFGRGSGTMSVDNQLVGELTLKFAVVDREA
ncbi:MAG: hypothetical protein K9N51_08780, partial [Candidatus Pacebacteria bacterium]|nr:hypothetical protein [Candidatus Paceibacterota bacterium]